MHRGIRAILQNGCHEPLAHKYEQKDMNHEQSANIDILFSFIMTLHFLHPANFKLLLAANIYICTLYTFRF